MRWVFFSSHRMEHSHTSEGDPYGKASHMTLCLKLWNHTPGTSEYYLQVYRHTNCKLHRTTSFSKDLLPKGLACLKRGLTKLKALEGHFQKHELQVGRIKDGEDFFKVDNSPSMLKCLIADSKAPTTQRLPPHILNKQDLLFLLFW